ncbi:MAG: gliding motility-associated C-terminal domain-containing protein, partial [Flavobacteriales bacterium]
LQPSPAIYDFYEWSTGVSGANKDTIHYKKPNTTVWVKVTDSNGCSDSAFADISMGDTLHVDFGGPKDVCADQSVVLNAAQFGPFTPVTHYTWTPAAPDQSTLTVTTSGTYSVLVEDGRGCQGDATVAVTIRELPKVDLRDSSTCFTGKEKIALSLPSIYKTVNWSTGSTSVNAIIYTPQKVKVVVTNQYDCAAADSANFSDFCEPTVLCFPTVVTPNGDGYNDEFVSCHDTLSQINDGNYKSIMNNILHVDFQIYNRWGIRVFQSLNTLPRWDCTYHGNVASPGVYYWVLRYTDSAHNNYEQTGWVQVVNPE